jgi:hypothetical protein
MTSAPRRSNTEATHRIPRASAVLCSALRQATALSEAAPRSRPVWSNTLDLISANSNVKILDQSMAQTLDLYTERPALRSR